MQADLVFSGGKIWTANPSQPWAEALAISGNRVQAVGVSSSMPEARQRIELEGRLVIPGLWDAHIHFYSWSLSRQQVKLAGVESLEAMKVRLADFLRHSPGEAWLTGWGWNEASWPQPAEPTRHDLDELTGPHRPCLLWRSDLHTAVANTCALRLAGLERIPEIDGGVVERSKDGTPSGLLRELAVNLVQEHIPAPTRGQTEASLLEGMAELHRLGITGICDQRIKDQDDGPKALAAYARLNRTGRLKLRISCNVAAHNLGALETLGLSSSMGDERLRLGHLKIFCDGTLGSRTAWVLKPFAGQENCGVVLTPPEQMREEIRRAVTLGFPVSIHAIGDRANRVCLDLFLEVQELGLEPPSVPHRIEHVQLLDDSDVERLQQLGLCASIQPGHILDDMDTAEAYLQARARLAYRTRELADSGVLLAFGSDAPVSEVNPFYGIHGAVYRQRPDRMDRPAWYPEQLLTLEQALIGYTIGAARAAGWDGLTGSLQVGKRADLCILDRDLFGLVGRGVQGFELCDTRVLLTMLDGEVVYRSSEFSKLCKIRHSR